MTPITDKELDELEAGKFEYDDKYACRDVPRLIAEVRRLRADNESEIRAAEKAAIDDTVRRIKDVFDSYDTGHETIVAKSLVENSERLRVIPLFAVYDKFHAALKQ